MMLSRWSIPAAGLALVLGLTACGARPGAAVQQTPVPSPMTSSGHPSPAASPSADPLSDIDRQLAIVDGSTAQSTGDLTAGDSSASTSDEGQ
ncbi:hypothetical protein F1C58_10535 [Glaciihabitans sp. INWT7]|uniref:hypothetical protein n=1 Tax=Glaciihabitans sp. INWT7 TaxID=2596912 RepID=UPI001627E6D0|nr:hypothetical protein [Glaciihabitans sp. INWT7]QNE47287.1 hypothetical protein F1C58_10535 [Glaciihabitans sp. INWT7]